MPRDSMHTVPLTDSSRACSEHSNVQEHHDTSTRELELIYLMATYKANKDFSSLKTLSATLLNYFLTALPFAVAIPDGITYHHYAKENAGKISALMPDQALSKIAGGWCEYGAPLGVYVFALNNVMRWLELTREAPMYRNYSHKKARYGILAVSGALAAVSVIPFYGMASDAGLPEIVVLLNSFARFCMDHYAWHETLTILAEKQKFKLTLPKSPFKKDKCKRSELPKLIPELVGICALITGAITATYLYPFATDVTNDGFALLGVAPTCLLWGMDSQVSWKGVLTAMMACCESKKESYIDKDLKLLRFVLLSVGVIIAAAGATSEVMMAKTNANRMPYPDLLVCSAIMAFPAIYFTGFLKRTDELIRYIQRKRPSPNGEEIQQQEKIRLREYLCNKIPPQATTVTLPTAHPGFV